jgi:hypothetical protein
MQLDAIGCLNNHLGLACRLQKAFNDLALDIGPGWLRAGCARQGRLYKSKGIWSNKKIRVC